jgi:hypothetical protein
LGFVAPNGRIVTCYHVASDEMEMRAHLADGRILPVRSVCALDSERGLAVLDVGLLDAVPVRSPAPRLAPEGSPVFVFGMVADEGRARWVEARIAAIQVLASSLTIYRIEGAIPPDASGGPLVGLDGETLGVVSIAETIDGTVAMAVPWKYVEPLLLRNQALPLATLVGGGARPSGRQIPQYSSTLLDHSSLAGLEATTQTIASAIRVGATAYNDGNPARCYDVYRRAAQQLILIRADCSGVQAALRAALAQAESLVRPDEQAWAMRDAFDGLLVAIEQHVRSHRDLRPAFARKPSLLN